MYVRADWQYTGDTWFHALQTEQVPNIWRAFGFGPVSTDFSKSARDAFDTLNLRVGIEGDNWSATVWGRNITDVEYLEEVIPAPEFGGSFNHEARGASYGVDFRYRF